MITLKPCDYLAVSIIPDKDNDISLADLIQTALDTFYLGDLLDMFIFKCSTRNYEQVLRFEDIQFKIPYDGNYKKQGIAVEFSGHGLDYYIEYIKSKNTTLRKVLRRFLALSDKKLKPNCSRFDFAFDEVCSSSDDKPFLDLDILDDCLQQRRFVTCFRSADPNRHASENKSILSDIETFENTSVEDINKNSDDSTPCLNVQSLNLASGRLGKTIYLGSMQSNCFIRFYDKFAEREKAGEVLPEDLQSWVRAEMVCRRKNAMSVLLEFCSLSESEFVARCAGHFFDKVRFIELDRSRRYNCSVCSWWSGFLNHAERAKFYHFKPKFNKFLRSKEYQKKQNAASLASIIYSDYTELRSILKYGFEHLKSSKTAQSILMDFEALQRLSPEEYTAEVNSALGSLSGAAFVRSFSDMSDVDYDHFMFQLLKEVLVS